MPLDTLRVLLVEDDDNHADLVAAYLDGATNPAVALVRVGTVQDAVEALAADRAVPFGAVLTDQQLPDSDYRETVTRVVAAASAAPGTPPVVALTSIGELGVALDALAQGAQDYVVKSEMSTEVLQRALRYAVERSRHANELRATNEALRQTLDHVRQMQAQLVEQEKLAALGRLLGGVAHELTNPLYLAMNFAAEASARADEIAALDLATDADERTDLARDIQANTRKVVEHVRRTDGVLRSMFEHAQGVAGSLQLTVLSNAVEAALRRLEWTHPDCPVERAYGPGEGPLVFGVAAALTRMVYNVVENAALAGAQPGADRPGVRVGVRHGVDASGEAVAIVEVRDRGPGIGADALGHVFEPFFTAWGGASRRTGLGLSLSHTIASSHGGRIELVPADGGGTCVRIAIPAGVPDLHVAETA